jgi:2-(1,2-epoxy-1,2-dihydrophenyl)acetyl-CoA isomerase
MVRQIAEELARGPREAFAAGKKAFNAAILPNLAESLAREGILQDELGKSAEHREAVTAFFEKRKSKYG